MITDLIVLLFEVFVRLLKSVRQKSKSITDKSNFSSGPRSYKMGIGELRLGAAKKWIQAHSALVG